MNFTLPILALWCYQLTVVQALPWTVTPFNPPAVPLAVRSPYLSAWLFQGKGAALNDAWPLFWTGSILGWAGFARIDGIAYCWLGTPGLPAGVNFTKAVQSSLEITSTQSIFVMKAGPVDLTITFLSPVEPADPVNQSLPFSYLAVSAAPNDGQMHNVQIYADISAEWISGDNSLDAQWLTTMGDVITHQVQLVSPRTYTEVNDRIQYGAAYHSTLNTEGATFQTGQDIVVRAQFIDKGVLMNSQDSKFRAVSDDWPVFALAHDLGSITTPSPPVVFSVGHARDPVTQYIVANNGLQPRSAAFWSRYPIINAAISAFLNDYDNAAARARSFDNQVSQDTLKISSDYASIVALSIRQTFGAFEITTPGIDTPNFDVSDILIFMKAISSEDNVNTADVIYPAWPLLLYISPALGQQLLLPLLRYQSTGQYPNAWAVHDLGVSYPNATGHNDGNDLFMPIEETGNMLIMTLSYAQRTNDTSLIRTFYNLLDQWGQYLVQNTLTPANQFSTDIFAGELANQTNLAIKGIIGIQAMSEIAHIMGDTEKSSSYATIASQFVQQWEKLAMAADGTHLTLAYGNDSSWGLAYNLYADKLLGTNIFPQSVYDLQTKWYSSQANIYGVPLDTRHTYTKSDWQMWTAAVSTNDNTRDLFISAILAYAADGNNSQPLGDWYDSLSGAVENSQRARPVVGGHLSLLALQSNSSIAPGPPSPASPASNSVPPGTPSSTSALTSPTPTSTNSAASKHGARLTFALVFACASGIALYILG